MKQTLLIFLLYVCSGKSDAHNWIPSGDATLMIEDQKLKVISDKKEEGANRFFDSEPGLYYKVYLDVLEENTDVVVSIISQPTTGTGGAVLKKQEVIYGKAELFFQAITDNTLISVRRENKDADGETIFFIEHIKVTFIEEKEADEPVLETKITHIIGEKKYELTDHLGNVKVIVSDKKNGVDLDNDGTVDYYRADVVQAQDYYAFGMVMPGRTFNPTEYRYGYNGKEKNDEIKASSGSSYDFGARMYDTRVGRWLSVDPIAQKYPSLSPYNFVANSPLMYVDPDGKRIKPVGKEATVAFEGLLHSFTSDDYKLGDVFHIQLSRGVYSSTDIGDQIASKREFNGRLRGAGIRLNNRDVKKAYSTYLGLIDSKTIELEVITAGTPSSTLSPGTEGTTLGEADPSLNTNPGLLKLDRDIKQAGQATNTIVNDLFTPNEGQDKYQPDSRDNNSVFFGPDSDNPSNNGIKGTILIDGTNQSTQQNSDNIGNAIEQQYPVEDE